jgi:hypothetical protein
MGSLGAYALNLTPHSRQQLLGIYRRLPTNMQRILRRLLGRQIAKAARPPISCICPTYGRVDLLEEALFSFLQQDYQGAKELVVLNDFEQQTLTFDHPDVRIINFPKRLRTLGEKYKAAVGLCTHDMIFVWHDDDIYLPQHLSHAVRLHYEHRSNLNPTTGKSFLRANKAWVWNDQHLNGPAPGRFHGGSSWTREQFANVRGYAHMNCGYAEELETQFEKVPHSVVDIEVAPPDIYYIYRKGGSTSYHLSDFASDGAGNEYERVADFVQSQAERGEIKLGHIELRPRWRSDYAAQVRDLLQSGNVRR